MSNSEQGIIMKIEKMEYVRIELHRLEAEELIGLLNEISTAISNMPEWAKIKAVKLSRELERNLNT